ncbi:hypothetical protein L5F39_04600 [Aliarcobacter butzleri]|uniref:hypothetical protein n=1 Tax=Aliarcobacter butzleri TaxID=28197 RepID=UPI001EDE4DBE|nr:hypothetical protein [Aliarcobacter butzleri]MCG3696891.1 hypothetical protein [Aliarcobacter butzleri]
MEDRLAKLEKTILDYYLAKGFKLFENQTETDKQWYFRVTIHSLHKQKELIVFFCEVGKKEKSFYFIENTTKEMFDKAIKHFSINSINTTSPEVDYKLFGYESDGRE